MKKFKSYIVGAMALVAATVGFSSCQDHFDEPNPNDAPTATLTANTSIADVKAMFWDESNNYCQQVGTKDNGDHIIVSGHVVSSDFAGNCFKYIVIQDETGALNFSINSYNLYLNYRRGQEMVIDLTGLYIGKYRGLFQVGFPSFNSSINGDETSFMAPEFFRRNAELNGWPNLATVDTITVNNFSELGTTPAELQKWQSQLVRFNNVEFVPNAETPTLSTYHSSGVTQQIKDAAGNTLDIRTSGYANFWNNTLPEGRGDVVALLGYYINLANSGGWQLTLLDAASLMNFGNPTVPEGTKEKPYTVQKAIALQVNSQNQSGWVQGYIVGTVAPEVSEVKSNADIDWSATPETNTTLVIGQTPDTKDISECLVMVLSAGSSLRTNGALRENPENYKKEINAKGTFASVLGTFGITNNNGSSSEYEIEGKEGGDTPIEQGDGTEEKPFSCAQIIAFNPQSTTDAVKTGVWTSGYIVGYYADYEAHFDANGKQAANILIADTPDASNKSQCVCIQLIASSEARAKLNLVDNPGNLGKQVAVFGDVMKYNTLPGIKNTSNYKLDGQGGGDTPVQPSQGVTLLDPKNANSLENWTITVVNGPETVWSWKVYNEAGYLNGSAFVNNAAVAAEAWAISPVIDLTSATGVSAEFEHAAKFQTTLLSLCGFAVRLEGASQWTMLNIPTWPTAGAWTFAKSGAIRLADYAGKKIQLAFKYGSSTAGADTWEIRNLIISGNGNITVGGSGSGPVTPPDPGTTGGDGTEASPFSVADIIAKGADFTQSGAYLKCYIVGAISDKSWNASTSEWAAPFTLKTNILVADSPNEKDWTKCVPVQLPSGDVRNALNLVDNPANLGKQVTLKGNVEKYFGKPGFKSVSSYTF